MKTIKKSFYELIDLIRDGKHPKLIYSGSIYRYDGSEYTNGFGEELKDLIEMQHWSIKQLEVFDDEYEIEDEFEDIETITSVENSSKELVKFADKINGLIKNQKKIIERLNND
jgi:hypothetical protein